MTNTSTEIRRGLALVRGRLKRLGVIQALLLGATVAGGALLLLMLADHLYELRALTRMLLLGAAALAVAAAAGWRLLRAPAHRPSDVDVALYVERRRPELQGALLAAVEFGSEQSTGSAIRSYIVDVLTEEAARKLQLTDLRRLVRLGRVRKPAGACLAVLVLLGLNAALFRDYFARQSRRVLTPWIAPPGPDSLGLQARSAREGFLTDDLKSPIRFRISPQNIEVPEGGRVEVTAALSRSPLDKPVLLCYRSQDAPFQQLPMRDVQRVYEYARALEDITRPIEYYVEVGDDASEHHFITVQQRLRVEGFELTYNYPDYLERPPRKIESQVGDISAVEGSKVTVRIKTNHPPASGSLKLTAGGEIPATVGPEGATAVIPVTANDTYHYVLRDEKGKELRSDTMFFIEAVPDNPPELEVVGPSIDLVVHPISELTVTVKVTEDLALADVRFHYEVMRDAGDGKMTKEAHAKSFMPKNWSGAVSEAQAVNVLELEAFQPYLREGDSILYHVEAEDRKGQKVASDMFSVVVADFLLCASYPDIHADADDIVIAPLMKFIAAAWHLEQQRGTIPQGVFLARSKAIAEKMKHPRTGDVINFLSKTGDATGVDRDPLTAEAYRHTVAAHGLLDQGEPGKAVPELKIVWGILMRVRERKPSVTYSGTVAQVNHTTALEEPTLGLAKILAYFNAGDPENMPPPPEASEAILLDVDYARKLGRKDVEKIAEVRKDIRKLRRQVQQIEEEDDGRQQVAMAGQTGDDSDASSNQRRRGQPGAEEAPQGQQGQPAGDGNDPARPGEDRPGAQEDAANRPNPQAQPGQQGTDQHPPGDSPDRPGQQGDGPNPPGDRQGQPDAEGTRQGLAGGDQGTEPRADRMMRRAEDAANQAENLAGRLHGQLEARDSKDLREGLNDLRAAAARLRRATREFDRRQVGAGVAETREADRLLGGAEQALAGAEQRTLNEMLAQATRQAYRLADRQGRIQTAVDELRKHDGQFRQALRAGRRDEVAQERARREGVVAALRALGEEARGFEGQLARTNEAATQARQTAVRQFVEEAARVMSRQDLPQDMVDSATDIRMGNLASARSAQDGAAQAIQQTLDALNNATDVLSGTRTGAIERANRIARRVRQEARGLLARVDGGPDDRARPGEQGKQPGRRDEEARPGDQGDQPGQGDDPARPGEQGKQPGRRDEEARPGGQADEPGQDGDQDRPGQPGERRTPNAADDVVAHSTLDRDAGQLWGDVRVLIRQLRALDIVPRTAVDILDRTSRSQEAFRRMFSRLRKQDAVAFVGVVSEVADRVAADLEKAKAERKLQAGLREECPPVYRRLVGMYYKALSGAE